MTKFVPKPKNKHDREMIYIILAKMVVYFWATDFVEIQNLPTK